MSDTHRHEPSEKPKHSHPESGSARLCAWCGYPIVGCVCDLIENGTFEEEDALIRDEEDLL